MEAVAAIALAGNVLQFVQVGLQILTTGNKLKRSSDGALKEHADIDHVLTDLDLRLLRLRSSPPANRSSVELDSLQVLSQRCQDAGQKLRQALLEAKSKGKGRWMPYRQAISLVWNKRTLDEAEKNMERLRDEIQFHLQAIIQQDTKELLSKCASTDQAIGSLQATAESTRQAIMNGFSDQKTDSAALFAELGMLRALFNQLLDLYKAIKDKGIERAPHANTPNKTDFLDSLKFSAMEDRKEAVPKAHMQTYQWLLMDPSKKKKRDGSEELGYDEERAAVKSSLLQSFEQLGIDTSKDDPFSLSQTDQCPSEHLQQWLHSGERIFWIWGKPGCGKSTLMKAILQNKSMSRRHVALLKRWSGSQKLILADFFFFRPGMSLQKSHVGFLRSLLYQILNQNPALIDQIWSPTEQLRAIARSKNFSDPNAEDTIWSLEQLKMAYRKWRRADSAKLFLLVDGIDEVESPPRDLVDILFDTLAMDDVKILVAGRSTPEFEDAFHHEYSLELNKVTELDILKFTVDNLKVPKLMDILDAPGPQFFEIIKEISSAAKGVFQWVKIVVDSLKHGLERIETYDLLLKRVQAYPKDLDGLYRFLLSKIEPCHLPDVAFWLEALLSVTTDSENLIRRKNTIKTIWEKFGEVKMGRFPVITTLKLVVAEKITFSDPLSLVKLRRALRDKEGELKGSRWSKTRSIFQRRVGAQCPHLLEFGPSAGGYRIAFAHRTVSDFLKLPNISNIWRPLIPSSARPRLAILASHMLCDDLSVIHRGKFPCAETILGLHCLLLEANDVLTTKHLFVQLGNLFTAVSLGRGAGHSYQPSASGWVLSSNFLASLGSTYKEANCASNCFAVTGICLSEMSTWISQEAPHSRDAELLILQLHWSYPVPVKFAAAGRFDVSTNDSLSWMMASTFVNVGELDGICQFLKESYARSSACDGDPISLRLLIDWLHDPIDWSQDFLSEKLSESNAQHLQHLYLGIVKVENKLRGSLQLLCVFISCLLESGHVTLEQCSLLEFQSILRSYESLIYQILDASLALTVPGRCEAIVSRMPLKAKNVQDCVQKTLDFLRSRQRGEVCSMPRLPSVFLPNGSGEYDFLKQASIGPGHLPGTDTHLHSSEHWESVKSADIGRSITAVELQEPLDLGLESVLEGLLIDSLEGLQEDAWNNDIFDLYLNT